MSSTSRGFPAADNHILGKDNDVKIPTSQPVHNLGFKKLRNKNIKSAILG